MSEKEWHLCEADRDNLLLRPEDNEILSATRQFNIELRAENERLRAGYEALRDECGHLNNALDEAETEIERLTSVLLRARRALAGEQEKVG